ncbi:hypothetical protein DYB36_012082 [Aphanomyces astaci]|uniref:Uncharacterized protein n=1 Tax=Aphanomyces astaci TaxID=112090 RepID=A0A397BS64_APHAT|nr:hypothetical protein DYB36_012082 [Aphanomyces astaci]
MKRRLVRQFGQKPLQRVRMQRQSMQLELAEHLPGINHYCLPPERGSDKKETKHKKKSSSKARRHDSSDSNDSGSSDSDHRSKKHKSSKKHKEKKAKKDKKSSKKSSKKSNAVNQNEYGKYGILRESDFHLKAVSFNVWLRDIKKINDFNGPKWEAMELFKEYMEDYNTATFPHEKYYDVEKYEMRKHHKKASKDNKRKHDDAPGDEEAMRRERLRQRIEAGNKDFGLIMQTMSKEKIEGMRNQEKLRTQMQLHYKSGNVTEARRLEVLLNKVDDKQPNMTFL